MRHMTIDEQTGYLMQGTEYGDSELKRKMTMELKERLISANLYKLNSYRRISISSRDSHRFRS